MCVVKTSIKFRHRMNDNYDISWRKFVIIFLTDPVSVTVVGPLPLPPLPGDI